MSQQFDSPRPVLIDTLSLDQRKRQKVFAHRIALRGRQLVPANRYDIISRYTDPPLMGVAQVALGNGQTALRRKAVQADRLGRVRRNSKTLLEKIANQNLAFCITGIDLF